MYIRYIGLSIILHSLAVYIDILLFISIDCFFLLYFSLFVDHNRIQTITKNKTENKVQKTRKKTRVNFLFVFLLSICYCSIIDLIVLFLIFFSSSSSFKRKIRVLCHQYVFVELLHGLKYHVKLSIQHI